MDLTDGFQAYTYSMSNGLLRISLGDIGRGAVVAIAAPLVTSIIGVLSAIILAPGFDFAVIDWASLGHMLVNTSIVSSYGGFIGYITKQLVTSEQGNILGVGDK